MCMIVGIDKAVNLKKMWKKLIYEMLMIVKF